MADVMVGKASTLVSAAMETAGAAIQSDMLDWVAGADGQSLAAVLYLIAIATAVIVFASGGNYKWGRYLLIGPTLFMFLTTVRSQSDGTEWAFGTETFEPAALKKALVGVVDDGTGTGIRVSTFFMFWNAFTSEVSQKLIAGIGLEESQSEYNFVNKVEKYMNTWNFLGRINDPNLRAVIKLTLGNQCREFFDAERKVYTPGSLPTDVQRAKEIVADYDKKKSILFQGGQQVGGWPDEVTQYIREKKLEGKAFTCRELWEELLPDVSEEIVEAIDLQIKHALQPGESLDKARETYFLKIGEYTGKYEGRLEAPGVSSNAKQHAINWLMTKALWNEIWEQNSHIARNSMTGGSPLINNGVEPEPGAGTGNNEDVAGAIAQFNTTESYGQRSEFVTAALSLPHYQGVGLLILSAAYPFFAMMTIIPGRALNFLSWMGLWAWLKLWDLGFAVVMLIDNMLYSLFPRGMNIEDSEVLKPGQAFVKMMEIDPMHSEAVYYNLIATCLFAVPMVTAVFVKGGGGELGNIMTSNWQQYSAKIAGGASSYSRSQQAQGHMKRLQEMSYKNGDKAMLSTMVESVFSGEVGRIVKLNATIGFLEGVMGKSGDFKLAGVPLSVLKSEASQAETALKNKISTAGYNAYYETSVSGAGQYASNRAVAVGYYSHDLQGSQPYEMAYKNKLASEYYDNAAVYDQIIQIIPNAFKSITK